MNISSDAGKMSKIFSRLRVHRLRLLSGLLVITLYFMIISFGFTPKQPLGSSTEHHYISKGYEETGAVNRVPAIYLGYRLYDTLGETIALIMVITAIYYLTQRREDEGV